MYCFRSINGHHTRRCGFNSRTNPIISSVGSLYNFKGKYYFSPYFQWHANTTDKHVTGVSEVHDNQTTKTIKKNKNKCSNSNDLSESQNNKR